MLLTDKACWVDPETGVDAEGRGTQEAPFKTLQCAIDWSSGTAKVVYAAAGDYREGGQSFYASWRPDALVTNRVCFWNNGDILVRGAGVGKSTIWGAVDPSSGGAGAGAVRPVGLYYGTAALQGFTLRNGWCRAEGNSADRTSALRKVDDGTLTLLDAEIVDCHGGSEGTVSGAALVRCRISGNKVASSLFHAGCVLQSCLVYEDELPADGSVFDWGGAAYGSTLVTDAGALVGHGTLKVYGSIVRHHADLPSSVITAGSLVNVEPNFVNAAHGDYRVRATSPAVGLIGSLADAAWFADARPYWGGDLSGARMPLQDPVAGCWQETVASAHWYVDASKADDTGDGLTPATAKKTLKGLFETCVPSPGDTVHAAEGVYDAGVMRTDGEAVGSRVVVPTGVALVADGTQEKTVIAGSGATGSATGMGGDAVRCVSLQPESTLRGFTLTGGRTALSGSSAATRGGGVFVPDWKSATVEDCLITDCRANMGGAASFALLKRCRILDNVADDNGRSTYYCRHRDCIVSNRTAGNVALLYAREVVNCTVVASAGANQQMLFADPGMGCEVQNSVFVGGKNNVNDAALAPKRCLFTTMPDYLGEGSRVVDAGSLAFDADFRPVMGANAAIDAGDAALRATVTTDATDVFGQARVSNGALDCGAVEADWRSVYAKDVCRSPRFKVAAADGAVTETASHAVRIPGGASLAVRWLNTDPTCTVFILTFRVLGTATFTLVVNGETRTFAASEGVQTCRFESAAAVNDLTLSCEGATAADFVELLSAEHPMGALFVVQ